MFCEVEIKIDEKTIKTTAMLDTGNLLKEPITNTPVIVVEHTLLYDCIPEEILNHLEELLGGDFKNISENIKADYIKIKEEERESKKKNIIVGIYNKSLTKRGEYRALLGIELLS